MERMDWGDAEDFVSFGNVSADQIDDSRYYILIAPQNVVSNTIITNGSLKRTINQDQKPDCISLTTALINML